MIGLCNFLTKYCPTKYVAICTHDDFIYAFLWHSSWHELFETFLDMDSVERFMDESFQRIEVDYACTDPSRG